MALRSSGHAKDDSWSFQQPLKARTHGQLHRSLTTVAQKKPRPGRESSCGASQMPHPVVNDELLKIRHRHLYFFINVFPSFAYFKFYYFSSWCRWAHCTIRIAFGHICCLSYMQQLYHMVNIMNIFICFLFIFCLLNFVYILT